MASGIHAGIKFKQKGELRGLWRLREINNPKEAKKIAKDVGSIIAQEANWWAPKSTGNLQENAYQTTWGSNKEGVWLKTYVRNTNKVPYALYQYFGEIYGPNQAVRDLKLRKRKASVTLKHIGWISPKGKGSKFPTGRMMGKRRTIKDYKGFILITGYTKNKRAKPKWLEYYLKHRWRLGGGGLSNAQTKLETECKRLIENGR